MAHMIMVILACVFLNPTLSTLFMGELSDDAFFNYHEDPEYCKQVCLLGPSRHHLSSATSWAQSSSQNHQMCEYHSFRNSRLFDRLKALIGRTELSSLQ